jgi:hypothetical protein
MLTDTLYNIALIAVIVICAVYVWAIVTYHEEAFPGVRSSDSETQEGPKEKEANRP